MNQPDIPIERVRDVVTTLLSTGHPSLVTVARKLDISPRTLQRRLAEKDLTHSQVLNQARIAIACQLLAKPEMHISDIARETGFATPSAFSRAFQTWVGTSPRAFRNGIKVQHAALETLAPG